jgi:hypothetical protein
LMRCNPVTYAVSGLRQIFMTSTSSPSLHDSNGLSFAPPFVLCWTVTGIFAVVMMGLATHVARNSTQGDLR